MTKTVFALSSTEVYGGVGMRANRVFGMCRMCR